MNINKKMYQSINTMRSKNQPYLSIMPFREYYMSFVGIRVPYLENGWGWFVDIELNSEAIGIQKYKKLSQYFLIPKTIQEYPSIRSMKSMNNLHDTSMIFEMNNVDNSKHRMNRFVSIVIDTLVGIIGVFLCYYFTCGKK